MSGLCPARADASGTSGEAIAYQVDTAHTGDQDGQPFEPPLTRRWSLTFPDTGNYPAISYPLIASGRVFVTVGDPSGHGGTLYALDAATGAKLWSQRISGSYMWSTAAYDAGRVFVVNSDGNLQAFDSTAGSPVWSHALGGQTSSPPVALDGLVYTSWDYGGGTLVALRESDGGVAWSEPVANGDNSAPALDASKVYVSYAGPQTYAFDRGSGSPVWHYAAQGSGGGGQTPALHGGRVYARGLQGFDGVYDATNGQRVAPLDGGPPPAFAGDTGVFVTYASVRAQAMSSGTTLWNLSRPDGISTPPMIAANTVYVGDPHGNLDGLDLATGHVVWTANLGVPVDEGADPVWSGMAAGEGLLVVPAHNTLTAFSGTPVAPGPRPGPTHTAGRDPHLTLVSLRAHRGHLSVRVQVARGAKGSLTLVARGRGRHHARARGHASIYAFNIHLRRARWKVTVTFRGRRGWASQRLFRSVVVH